jgi:DNA replication protein DnaC
MTTIMKGRKASDTQKQEEQFTGNCRYLGLKLLAEEYRQIVDRANENTVGYYEFISSIVQTEAVNKRQRHIEYLVKTSRLPQPCKLLADLEFGIQPRLNRKLIM